MKKLMGKRIAAILLAAIMLAALMPATALAHSGEKDVHDHTSSDDGIRVRIEAGAHGDIDSPGSQSTPDQGETWTFTAKPDSGYKFDHWEYSGNEVSGALSANGANLSISFTQRGTWIDTHWEGWKLIIGHWDYAEYRAQAVFAALPSYTLSTSTDGSGSVSKNPNNTDYSEGTDVTLTAKAEPGWQFSEWSGSVTGTTNPVTVRMDGDKSVKATFTLLPTYTLDVVASPSGSGSVSKNPDVASYWQGRNVTLTANAVSGYRFGEWSGGASGTANPLTLTMDSSKNVTATFIKQYYITLNTNDGHFNNEGGVKGWRDENSTINLNDAEPDPDNTFWMFSGWRDNDTGEFPCSPTFTLTGNRSFTAVFARKDYLSLDAGSHGHLDNSGLAGHYPRGKEVNLNDALPAGDPGYTFDCWKEHGLFFSGSGTVVTLKSGQPIITIGDSNYFKAYFKIADYSITYLGGGTASGNPATYRYFDAAFTLSNPTRTGYTFAGWTGTGLSGATMSVTVPTHSSGDRTYTANWTPVSYVITYNNYGTVASNPTAYTIESSFTLNNPTRAGYEFTGWTGTGLTGLTMNASVAAGNTGAREYTANWRIGDITVTGYDEKYDAAAHSVSVTGALPTDTVTYSTNGVNYDISKPTFTNVTSASGVTVYVKVERAGAADYLGSAVVKINPVELTVTADTKTIVYGDDAPAYTAAITGYVPGEDASVLTGAPNLTCAYVKWNSVGEYTIDVAMGTLSAENYTFTLVDGILTVDKKELTVTADDLTITYGDAVPVYTYKIGIYTPDFWEGTVSGAAALDCDYSQGDNADNYGITIDVSSMTATNYTFRAVDGTLTVAQKILRITANDETVTYGDAVPDYTATYDGFISGEDENDLTGMLSFRCSYAAGKPAGEYGVMPQGLLSNNYMVIFNTGLVTVNKAPLKVTADNKAVTFLDAPPAYTATFDGFVGGDDVSDLGGSLAFNCSYAAGSAAGTYTITPKDVTSDNYEISFVPGTLTVNTLYLNVRFVDYDGDELGTDTVAYGTAADAPANPSRTGYRFTGWDKPFNNVTSDLTVTARYSIRQYTVEFVNYDGTLIDSQSVKWKDGAIAPSDPVREGYTFIGWDISFDPVTKNLVVTALYQINTYTVTFVDYDGTVIDTQTADWNTAATAPADPDRDGYEFTGWDVPFNAVTANITVTAGYEQIVAEDSETVPVADTDEDIPLAGGTAFAWWWILIGLGAAALLLFLIFFVWKRRRPEEEQQQ